MQKGRMENQDEVTLFRLPDIILGPEDTTINQGLLCNDKKFRVWPHRKSKPLNYYYWQKKITMCIFKK